MPLRRLSYGIKIPIRTFCMMALRGDLDPFIKLEIENNDFVGGAPFAEFFEDFRSGALELLAAVDTIEDAGFITEFSGEYETSSGPVEVFEMMDREGGFVVIGVVSIEARKGYPIRVYPEKLLAHVEINRKDFFERIENVILDDPVLRKAGAPAVSLFAEPA